MAGDENLRRRNGEDAAGDNRNAGVEGEASISLSEIANLDGDDDGEEDLIGIEEEAIAEVMRSLEREIRSPSPIPPAINGNQESCGPSISDSASTVMASVDTGGGGGVSFFFGVPAGPDFPAAEIGRSVGNQPADGGAGEEWLAVVLSEVELDESLFLE